MRKDNRPVPIPIFAGVAMAMLALLVPVLHVSAQSSKPPFETIGPLDLVVGEDKIQTLLPPDGIPAISSPEFLTVSEADKVYLENEPILGVAIGGEARAYSLWTLDRHEIVNDTVGGQHLAATW